jgi:hypothetical protein
LERQTQSVWETIDNNWVLIISVVVAVLSAFITSGLIEMWFPTSGPALKGFLVALVGILGGLVARHNAYGKHTVKRIRRRHTGH